MYADWTSCRCSPDNVCKDGNGEIHYKGRKDENDTVEDLLNRIDWVSSSGLRTNNIMRSFNIAFLCSVFITAILWRKWPKIYEFLIVFGIIFIVTLSLLNLYEFHSGIYPIYYIKDDIQEIRKILNTSAKDPPKPGELKEVPHHTIVRQKIEKNYKNLDNINEI